MLLKRLLISFTALTASSCVHVVSFDDIMYCIDRCEHWGVVEVGRQPLSSERCCLCGNGVTYHEQGVSPPQQPAIERQYY